MTFIILEATLRSCVLIAAAWLLIRMLRIRSPRIERTVWLVTLLACAAMPLLMQARIPADVIAPVADWVQRIDVAATAADRDSIWPEVLAEVLVCISALLVLRQLIGIVRLWRVSRRATELATELDIKVRASSEISAPATAFSTILVPPDFTQLEPGHQRAVLAHESTHVRQHDFLALCIARLHRNLFWFNPLAWWLERRLSLLSEYISDDAASASLDSAEYATLLVRFASQRASLRQSVAAGPMGQLIGMSRRETLSARIDRILSGESTPQPLRRVKQFAAAAVLLPLIGVVALPSATSTVQARVVERGDIVLPRSHADRPLSQPVYPPMSRRLKEQGTVVLRLLVLEDGSVADAEIFKSSGHPSLDYAAMYESFRWNIAPGTVDGEPSRMWGKFAVTFKLTT